MFCETKDMSREALKALGLSFNPFKAVVSPRPIGWVTTMNSKGVVNLAPYSFFNAVSSDPPMVFFRANGTHDADGGEKDSLRNVRETGEFVCNFATWALRHEMVLNGQCRRIQYSSSRFYSAKELVLVM